MKRQWKKHRQFVPNTDGEQRWDRAYQYLLQWVKEVEPDQVILCHPLQMTQEVDYESSHIYAGFDEESSGTAHD
jgi:hypothetical protein